MSEVGKLVQLVDGHPLLYTVEEAAGVLRIGRTLAYALARRYETSGGRDGLPVVRLGNCLRVPHWALMELACNGRVVTLSELDHGRPRERVEPNAVRRVARPSCASSVDRASQRLASPRPSLRRSVESPDLAALVSSVRSSSSSCSRPELSSRVPAAQSSIRSSKSVQTSAQRVGGGVVVGRCCG